MCLFLCNATPTTNISTNLSSSSLHDALPISIALYSARGRCPLMVDLATGEQAARHFFSKAGARTARRKTGTVPIFRLERGACPIQMGTVPVFRLSAQQAARLSREERQDGVEGTRGTVRVGERGCLYTKK